MDGLHYVRSKVALIKELSRTAAKQAIWLFPHMHNALGSNFSPGCPLAPEQYKRCFDGVPLRMLVELDVLRDFARERRLDLSQSRSGAELDQAPVLSVVAGRRPDLWRVHRDVAAPLERQRSSLSLNPIYRVTGEGRSIRLRMEWPSTGLETECGLVREFMPQECDIDRALWTRLKSKTLNQDDDPQIAALIRSFVLVPLPEQYS
jgi:hypothetical protein